MNLIKTPGLEDIPLSLKREAVLLYFIMQAYNSLMGLVLDWVLTAEAGISRGCLHAWSSMGVEGLLIAC